MEVKFPLGKLRATKNVKYINAGKTVMLKGSL
jgi:hypothetical protein